MSRPEWIKQLADYKTLSNLLKQLAVGQLPLSDPPRTPITCTCGAVMHLVLGKPRAGALFTLVAPPCLDLVVSRPALMRRPSGPCQRRADAGARVSPVAVRVTDAVRCAVAGKSTAFSAITSLSMSGNPDKAFGASPEIIIDGKAFKEVDWFKLVDKEIDIVTRQTNTEILRVRNELTRLRDACQLWSTEMKDKNAEQTGSRARAMLARMAVHEKKAKLCGEDFLTLEK